MKDIIFMGTPEFAVPSLEKLILEGYNIKLVVTQPDRVQGRRRKIIYSPVKEFALKHNLKLIQPHNIKDSLNELYEVNADLIITAAYGQILPKELLDNIKAINVHGSILPKYRGGAPIQYALFDGLKKTGVTIMDMAFKMDSGDIILQEEIDILKTDNYETLSERLSHLGAMLLIDALKNDYERIKQDEELVTFAYTLKREDEFLDVYNNNTEMLKNRLRGLLPEPAASININNITYKVYNIEKSDIIKELKTGEIYITKRNLFIKTKEDIMEIKEIQAPGKKRLKIIDFLNGQNEINSGDFVTERNK